MGGWITIIGDTPDLKDRLARFQRTFSVEGVPELLVETHQHTERARTIAWAWNRFRVPDVFIRDKGQGEFSVLCGAITDFGRFGPVTEDQVSTAARILDLWEEQGDNLIDELNGSFSCLFYDQNREEITLYTDRFASRSLWFTEENGVWIVGNFPSAIATLKKNTPTINPVGLWSLFNTGRHVGEYGLYSGIRCLLAGQKAILSSSKQVAVKPWWTRRYRPDRGTPPREWGQRISHVLKKSSAQYKKVCANPFLFMSGGLDSRIAAAAFGKPLKSVSLCTMPNAETRLAAMSSKMIGIDHKIITRSPYWYLDTLEPAALISAGNYLTQHTHFIVPVSDIASENTEAEFLLGDLLENFNKHYFTIPIDGKLTYDPKKMREILHSWIPYSIKETNRLGIFFNNEIKQRVDKIYLQALQHYAQSLMEVSEDPSDRLDTFLRWADVSITPTYNMITCLWPLAGERNIFFDNKVNEISLQIPSALRGAGILHKWTLYYLNKTLPLIPNANTWLPPILPNKLGSYTKKIRPFLGRVRRGIIPKQSNKPVLQTSGSWVLMHEMCRKDSRYKEKIEETINDMGIFPPEIFDVIQIKKTWQEYLAGNINLHFEIQALLSFGTLHRLIPCKAIEL